MNIQRRCHTQLFLINSVKQTAWADGSVADSFSSYNTEANMSQYCPHGPERDVKLDVIHPSIHQPINQSMWCRYMLIRQNMVHISVPFGGGCATDVSIVLKETLVMKKILPENGLMRSNLTFKCLEWWLPWRWRRIYSTQRVFIRSITVSTISMKSEMTGGAIYVLTVSDEGYTDVAL